MAVPPFVINEALPGDSDLISGHPTQARAFRDIVEDYLNTDHDFNTGGHNRVDLSDLSGNVPTFATGRRGVWQEGGTLNTRLAAGTVDRMIFLPVGTKMAFFQASAPAGWTQDTTQNDKVLRVVSGVGGGSAGSWTISGVTVNSHTLTVSEIPAHKHDIPVRSFAPQSGSTDTTRLSEGGDAGISRVFTGVENTGGGAGHTHGLTADGNWRPAYIDVIVCSKN